MRTARTVLAAITAAITLPALTSTAAVADPPPGGVTVDVVTINGSGCPNGSTAVALSGDAGSLTITRSGMRAEASGTSSPADERKNCQISLRVHVPQGYSYGIKAVEYNGTAHLEPGASGTVAVATYFQGQPIPEAKTKTLKGPFSGQWQFTISDEDPAYSPCGEQRNFNIPTDLSIDPGTSDPSKLNYMTMDGKSVYQLSWKRCAVT